jgi:hypothetical protein
VNEDAVTPSRPLYRREEFERIHRRADSLQRRHSWILALSSIVLAALLVLSIIALRDMLGMARTAHLFATLFLFLLYLVVLGGMLLALRVRLERVRPVCPNCGVTLNLLGEYVAMNTGKCNVCDGQVIEDVSVAPTPSPTA